MSKVENDGSSGDTAIALHSGEYVERFKAAPRERLARLVELMAIGPSDKIVDLGCGTGMLLSLLPESAHYDGVDFSQDFVDAARKLNPKKGNFHCTDIVEYCNKNKGKYDIATTMDFSEHVDNSEFVRIYSAIRESMREGGVLYLHTPNGDFIVERLKRYGILRQFPEHIAVRSARENVAMLKACGFREVTCKIIPHYNGLRLLHGLRRLPLVGALFGARVFISAKR